jgi:hypothetical protein
MACPSVSSLSPLSPQAADKLIDSSGTFVAKEDVSKDANVVTPIYETTSTFYGGSENDSTVVSVDTSLQGTRSGYYKFRLGGFKVNQQNAIDLADFDNAWHEAFNMIHGSTDGMYYGGESIFKVEEETAEMKGDDIALGRVSTDNVGCVVFQSLSMPYMSYLLAVRSQKYPSWYYRWLNYYVWQQYRCNYCPDDDSAAENFALVGKSDPVFNNKSLTAVAKKACEIMIHMGNDHFTDVHDCTAVVTSPEEFVEVFVEKDDEDILSASA